MVPQVVPLPIGGRGRRSSLWLVHAHVVDFHAHREGGVVGRAADDARHRQVEQQVLRVVEGPAAVGGTGRLCVGEVGDVVHAPGDGLGRPANLVAVEGVAGVGDVGVRAAAVGAVEVAHVGGAEDAAGLPAGLLHDVDLAVVGPGAAAAERPDR